MKDCADDKQKKKSGPQKYKAMKGKMQKMAPSMPMQPQQPPMANAAGGNFNF